ncbi:Hypothetical protein GLP15_4789 [Giardia lamblia P15]|uniref:Uncharacterized protein n=1 Tax=Giardia intestinalis (strain P15) TaxID=658858 RepID=E1F9P0_GIAIA|nr:Hypothetical protein GLP15_4789 [Giardia lamblia P15]
MQRVFATIQGLLEQGDLLGGADRLRALITSPTALATLIDEAEDGTTVRESIGLLMSLMGALWLLSRDVARPIFKELLDTQYAPALAPPYTSLPEGITELNVFLAILSTLDTILSEELEPTVDGAPVPRASIIQLAIVEAYLSLRPCEPALAIWADFVLVPLILTGKVEEAKAIERVHPKIHHFPKGTALHDLVSALYPLDG